MIEIDEPTIREASIPVGIVRDGDGATQFVSVKHLLDPWREFPERRTGTAKMLTLDSFIALVQRHKDDGSAVFGDFSNPAAPRLVAVLDYHRLDGAARHGGHRVSYAFPLSDEWKLWNSKNSSAEKATLFDQADFAMMIEDRIQDLASPYDQERTDHEAQFGAKFAVPSELMMLSKGLEINMASRIKEVRNLQSGEAQVVFEEVHEDGKGKPIKVPGLFVVAIPLFVGGEKVRIITRLLYRKAGTRLAWFFQMIRPDLVIRERLTADLLKVGADTGLPTFEGTPEVGA